MGSAGPLSGHSPRAPDHAGLTTPAWQKTIWLEELDVAWHRGQLPQFMEVAVAGDKLRLCIYQDKLGQVADSERLAGELIAAADPARMSMAELLALLRTVRQ